MRNLTIKREKSFVGSLAKMKIYIEDPTSNEMRINDIPCRKIGDLKNGEEKVFQIDEQKAKIFVIADNLSKNYCNEYYQLPEGQKNIFLSGKNKLSPANGNAFRFDNNESEESIANRKSGARKGMLILIISDITLTVASNHIATAAPNELKLERDIFISQYFLNPIDYLDQLIFCRGSFFLGNIFEVVHS